MTNFIKKIVGRFFSEFYSCRIRTRTRTRWLITIAEVTCFMEIEEQEPCLYRKIEKKRVVHSPTWHELVKWKQFNTKMTHSKTKPNPFHFSYALSINFLGNAPSPWGSAPPSIGNVMLPLTHERNAPTCFGKVRNISK